MFPLTQFRPTSPHFTTQVTSRPLIYLGIGLSLLSALAPEAQATVGATTPFKTYEAEAGILAGGATVVSEGPPTNKYSTPALEASGRSYVQLGAVGQSVTLTNAGSKAIGAINVRFCIPDAAGGSGTIATLNLYVNGTFRQSLTLSSAQSWLYQGVGYHGNSNNPADGQPWRFWDELPVIIAGSAVPSGSTIKLQVDAGNSAAYYRIDCVDMEPLPAPIAQPANSLSITSYGAVANSPGTDSTPAIQNCINAAAATGKIVWIPQGTFYLNKGYPGLKASNPVEIQGAGMWYSVIYHNPALPVTTYPNGSNLEGHSGCVVKNLAFDSNAINGIASGGACGGFNMSGSNWLIDSVWVRHCSSGLWGGGTNGTIQNCRINNTWGDGININNVTDSEGLGNNIKVLNNHIRASGDDGIAINSVDYNNTSNGVVYYTTMENPVVANNTVSAIAFASPCGIYGGANALIQNNLLSDGAFNYGLSIGVFNVNGSSLESATVTGNTIQRCGGLSYDSQHPAVLIGTPLGAGYVKDVYFGGNTINTTYFDGIRLLTSSGIVLQNNTVSSPSLTGLAIPSEAIGSAILDSNTISGVAVGQQAVVNSSSSYALRRGIQATSYYTMAGGITTVANPDDGGYELQNITNNSSVCYKDVDLRNMTAFTARVSAGTTGGTINIRLDSATGPLIGTCTVSPTGGWHTWTDVACSITPTNGFRDVYLVFTGTAAGLMNLAMFSFSQDADVTEASDFTTSSGVTVVPTNNEGGPCLQNIANGAYTSYANVNMTGLTNFYIRAASGNTTGGTINVRLDSPTGTSLGTVTIPYTGGWGIWTTGSCVLTPSTGIHILYLVYDQGGGGLNVSWFQLQAGAFQSTTAVQAATYNSCFNVSTEACSEGGLDVDYINNGSYTAYNYVNFTGVKTFTARVASAAAGGDIELRLDSATGPVVGICSVPSTGGWQKWTTQSCNVTATTGFHTLYLKYTGGAGVIFNVQNFQLGY